MNKHVGKGHGTKDLVSVDLASCVTDINARSNADQADPVTLGQQANTLFPPRKERSTGAKHQLRRPWRAVRASIARIAQLAPSRPPWLPWLLTREACPSIGRTLELTSIVHVPAAGILPPREHQKLYEYCVMLSCVQPASATTVRWQFAPSRVPSSDGSGFQPPSPLASPPKPAESESSANVRTSPSALHDFAGLLPCRKPILCCFRGIKCVLECTRGFQHIERRTARNSPSSKLLVACIATAQTHPVRPRCQR